MSFLSKISLANRSLVALATIAILIFGGLVIPSLKQELFPSLQFPAVTVFTIYPGASPAIVEQDVTDPLEQSIQGMPGIQSLTSYSNQNESIIVIAYNFGTDINTASQKLSQQISHVQTLPSGVKTPQIETFDINSLPIIQLAVTANEDQTQLAADLKAKVVPALSGLDGVAQVNVTGVTDQIVRITPNVQKMAALGLNPATVFGPQGSLVQNNITIPAGQVTNDGKTFAISAGNQFKSLSDLQNLVVGMQACPTSGPSTNTPTSGTGSQKPGTGTGAPAPGTAKNAPTCQPTSIHLSDIATVEQVLAPSTSLTRTNGEDSLGISITKTSDGNTVNISNAVNDKISALQDQLGNDAKITGISDQAPMITSSVSGLVREGLIGAGFAVLVILLFLFSLRSTLVTAISIPLSIIIALIALWIGNLSLNLFTLGAMTIAVGRVVDDSIVVLENIYRHLGNGEPKEVAIPTAVREVAGAVTSSTLTTIAVFLPIAFTGGLIGQVFGPFGITVTVALLASLFVALTIIPVLAYWFLKAPKARGKAKKAQESHERQTWLERGYVPAVRWVTAHKIITLILACVLFFGSTYFARYLGTNFFSSSSQNTYSISETLPVGTSLDVTEQDAQQIEDILQSLMPPIQHYQMTVGSSGMFAALQGNAGGGNSATFTITTDPNVDQAAFQSELQSRLNTLYGVGTVQFSASQGGGFDSSNVAMNVQAPDQDTLNQATQQVLDAFHKVSHLTNITSNLAAAAPLIDVQVDPSKAAQYGLTAFQIGTQLNGIYNGTRIMTVNFDGQQEDVDLQTVSTPPSTVDDLRKMPVLRLQNGTIVTLGDVAIVTQKLGPTQITHIAGERTATVSATATTDDVGSVSMDLQKQINALHLPAGASVSTAGVGQNQSQAFQSLGLALLAAILLVYLVMVATFRSLVQPLILLISIPFAATGSLLLMLATHTPLGVPSLIGLLMLVGIVVTNAIVLLDLVHQYREKGLDARAAVVEGGRRRLRPILMTAIATILALLPMALGLSKDSGFIAAPLAITVIGGLASSTVLTLLLVPTLYVMVEGRKDRRKPVPPQPKEIERRETRPLEVIQGV